jgi:hypothetical protein
LREHSVLKRPISAEDRAVIRIEEEVAGREQADHSRLDQNTVAWPSAATRDVYP